MLEYKTKRTTRYRSNKSVFEAFSHNNYCSLRGGRGGGVNDMVFHLMRNIFQARGVVLAALIDFCLFRQKHMLPRKRSVAMPYGIALKQRFFSFFVYSFSFARNKRERINKKKFSISYYIPIILIMRNSSIYMIKIFRYSLKS